MLPEIEIFINKDINFKFKMELRKGLRPKFEKWADNDNMVKLSDQVMMFINTISGVEYSINGFENAFSKRSIAHACLDSQIQGNLECLDDDLRVLNMMVKCYEKPQDINLYKTWQTGNS